MIQEKGEQKIEDIKLIAEYDGLELKIVDLVRYPEPNHQWEVIKDGKTRDTYYGSEDNFYRKSLLYYDLNTINPVWVKVYAEATDVYRWMTHSTLLKIIKSYHSSIDTGNISQALTAVADAIRWIQSQRPINETKK